MLSIERISVSIIFIAYALVSSLLAAFVLMWDNKGAIHFWDKNINDWLTFTWLIVISVLAFISAKYCYRKKHISILLPAFLSLTVIVNVLFIVSWEQNETLIYYGIFHGVVLIGCGLWWHSLHVT